MEDYRALFFWRKPQMTSTRSAPMMEVNRPWNEKTSVYLTPNSMPPRGRKLPLKARIIKREEGDA